MRRASYDDFSNQKGSLIWTYLDSPGLIQVKARAKHDAVQIRLFHYLLECKKAKPPQKALQRAQMASIAPWHCIYLHLALHLMQPIQRVAGSQGMPRHWIVFQFLHENAICCDLGQDPAPWKGLRGLRNYGPGHPSQASEAQAVDQHCRRRRDQQDMKHRALNALMNIACRMPCTEAL